MLKKFNLIVLYLFLFLGGVFAQDGSGTIKGLVKDESTGKPLFGVVVALKSNGNLKMRAKTDAKGLFRFDNLVAGKYDLEFKYPGYPLMVLKDEVIKSEGVLFLNDLRMGVKKTETVVIKRVPPKINPSGPTGQTFTAEDMKNMGARDATSVAAQTAAVTQQEGSSGLNIKGASTDASQYVLDGVKMRVSPTMPKEAMQEVAVITGGIPANYGDVTGGIISITTKGPSSKFFGSAEVVSSGLYFKGKDPNGYDGKVFGLDKYGYNLFEALLSGPLLMKKDSLGNKSKNPLMGFLTTINYTYQLDPSPLANGGAYRVKKDVRDYLIKNPLRFRPNGQVPVSNALFLTKDDFEKNPWNMNSAVYVVSSSSKIDVKLPRNMNLVFGGNFSYSNSQTGASLLNVSNNGVRTGSNLSTYIKFGQRFYAKESQNDSVKPLIRSAAYNFMVDYTNSSASSYDTRYKYDAFKYGHIGTFTSYRTKHFTPDYLSGAEYFDGYRDSIVNFVPDQDNIELAASTIQYFDMYKNQSSEYMQSLANIQANKGVINGALPEGAYGHSFVGTPYASMSKASNEQFRITGSGNALIGEHLITIGFEFEKRWDRSWAVNPLGLWTLARLKANSHITEVGTEVDKIDTTNGWKKVTFKPINSSYAATHNGVYGGDKNSDVQSFFDYNLRKKLNLSVTDNSHLDVMSLSPNLLSVDMFSQDELLNNGAKYVSYYGYDISGNRVSGNTDVDNYFTAFDKNNNFKRFVGAYQPTYFAGYLMDKFAINNLVFNVGVRVDVFDANQPVLKDPYLLYQAHTVREVKDIALKDNKYSWINIPNSVGDDYIVYVNDMEKPTQITGFRSGSQWFSANGNPTEKSSEIRGPNGITPWLLDPQSKYKNNSIKASAFENYKPQVNVMPRLAFSFPIAEKAAFTAHYDILTIRPNNGLTRFDPTDYQFLATASTPSINNTGLKPKQTIDYEVGFQQELSENSSIKISGFYREQRNDIQVVRMIDAYPNSYTTYGNIDFGTVKGMTFSYDLRRVNNLRLTANYTLQFAEGTGASSITSKVTSMGYNFRYILPYSYDIRHQLNIVADYRYEVEPGKKYSGPMIGSFELFNNTGLNVTTNIYSGSPYTAAAGPNTNPAPGITGTVNGSRLPWTYRLDMVLDRNFEKIIKKQEGEITKEKKLYFNVYIRATNLFNQLNILSVYPGTGSWKDDGYLAAAANQNTIQQQLSSQSFIDYYKIAIQNPGNLSSPRTLRLGVRVDF